MSVFKCISCGLSFDTAEEYMRHKLAHQERPEKKGLVCLGCGKSIPLDSSQENYRGDITCPGCGQKLRVALQDGEVMFASTREN